MLAINRNRYDWARKENDAYKKMKAGIYSNTIFIWTYMQKRVVFYILVSLTT